MSDLFLLLGLALLAVAGFLFSTIAGFAIAGIACLVLALAYADEPFRLPKIPRLRLWHRS